MKNPIKWAIRWWSDPDHRGAVIGTGSMILVSVVTGYESGSILLGIFVIPLLMLAALSMATVIGLPLGLTLYFLIEIVPKWWKRLTEWAYAETDNK